MVLKKMSKNCTQVLIILLTGGLMNVEMINPDLSPSDPATGTPRTGTVHQLLEGIGSGEGAFILLYIVLFILSF